MNNMLIPVKTKIANAIRSDVKIIGIILPYDYNPNEFLLTEYSLFNNIVLLLLLLLV
jgi:hypothetical protein